MEKNKCYLNFKLTYWKKKTEIYVHMKEAPRSFRREEGVLQEKKKKKKTEEKGEIIGEEKKGRDQHHHLKKPLAKSFLHQPFILPTIASHIEEPNLILFLLETSIHQEEDRRDLVAIGTQNSNLKFRLSWTVKFLPIPSLYFD